MQAFALKSVCTGHAFCIVLGMNVPKDASLPCKEGVFLHAFVDFLAYVGNHLLVGGRIENFFYHLCNFVHKVFFCTARGNGRSAETNA